MVGGRASGGCFGGIVLGSGVVAFVSGGFFGFVGTETGHHLIPIDLVRVKLRSIDADKAGLASNRNAASSAHSGSVHHDGVQAGFGRDVVFRGCKCHEFHHDGWADSNTFIDGFALDDLLYANRYDAFLSHRAIIGHDDEFVGVFSEFVFEDNQVFVSCGQDSDNAVSGSFHGLRDRQSRSSSDATTSEHNSSVIADIGRFTERSDQVCEFIAGLKCTEFGRRNTNSLNDEINRAFFRVCVANGKRHSFGIFVHANDDEMSCLTAFSDKGSFHYKLGHIVREKTFAKNFIHCFVRICA